MFAVIPIVAIFLILILFVMFFSLPYWFYFLVAFLSYSYYEKLTYFVIINSISIKQYIMMIIVIVIILILIDLLKMNIQGHVPF